MLQHIAEDHANDTIQPNDSIHSASDVDLIFDIDNNDDDDIDIGSNINNLSIDMSLMSIDEVGSDDNDDVGEILDSDDRTWTNDMIDDDESDATTDYVMEEQIRSEDIPPCDTYQYQSSEEGQTDPNKMNMHDFSYMKGAHNRMFYMQEHNICNGGIRGLAHRAASRMNSSEGHVGFKEADILLDISENLFSKSKSDQMKHLNTLKKVFSLFPHSEPQSSVNIPLEIKAANDVCLENKYAIVKNLPHPEPFLTDCGHVGISLEDLLDHIMAAGEELSFIDPGQANNVGLNASPAAAELRENIVEQLGQEIAEDTRIGQLILWSDSFLRCFSRQRENSVWLLVVQVCSGKRYTLAFGSSKLDHSAMVERYMKELLSIRSGKRRYYGREGVKSFVNTAFDLIIYLADTPERNSLLGTMNLGLYGLRSLYAGRVSSKYQPPCNRCFAKLICFAIGEVESVDIEECCNCCGWNYNAHTRAIEYDKTANTKYPTRCSDNNPHIPPSHRGVNERHLLPVYQSFEWMVDVLRFAFYETVEGPWSKTGKDSTTRYLQTCGINQKTQDKLFECAIRRANGENVSEDEYIPFILRSGYKINIFVDTAMHLIGHGIIGTLLELMESVLTEHKLWTAFQNFANPILSEIADMRLDWCKIKTLPNTNWLAEDCFGFGRIVAYIIGLFLESHNLEDHRLETTADCVIRLREIYASFHVMPYLLMSREKEPKDEIDAHIKIFLSCCHRFCEEYYDRNVGEFWSTKGNFVSLLNLPDQIEYFGNMFLYWEGIFEAAIQPAKKKLKYVRKNPSSLLPAMRCLHKEDSMSRIRERLDITLSVTEGVSNDMDDKEEEEKRYKGCRIYRSENEINSKFSCGACVSGFMNEAQPGTIFIPYSAGKTIFKVMAYDLGASVVGSNFCGLPYFSCQSGTMDDGSVTFRKKEMGNLVTSYCLLLPHHSVATDAYSIITHKWKIFGKEYKLVRPSIVKGNDLFH